MVQPALKVRWCETHDGQHYLKDACMRRMIAILEGRPGGAVNVAEQMDGPEECVEGWRAVYPWDEQLDAVPIPTPDPDGPILGAG